MPTWRLFEGCRVRCHRRRGIISPTGTVQAGKDEVVAHIVTDEDGVAHARGRALETAPPTIPSLRPRPPMGMCSTRRRGRSRSRDHEPGAEVAHADVVVSNNPTHTVIGKTDAQTGEWLQGATLALWNIDDQISVDPSPAGRCRLACRGETGHRVLEILRSLRRRRSRRAGWGRGCPLRWEWRTHRRRARSHEGACRIV